MDAGSRPTAGSIARACAAIRRYIAQRPGVCDAFEGVARFWVNGDVSDAALLAALGSLVRSGELRRVDLCGQVHYAPVRRHER